MKGDNMSQDNVTNEVSEEIELYAVTCIHCGKTTFKFSRNTLYSYGYDDRRIELKCPRCGNITVYNSNGTIEAG